MKVTINFLRDLYLDGTFHLLKYCGSYKQIYIISVLYEENNCIFSYPILFSLMKNRYTVNYCEIFNVINHHYYEKFNVELSPTVFRLDWEAANIRAIK